MHEMIKLEDGTWTRSASTQSIELIADLPDNMEIGNSTVESTPKKRRKKAKA